MKLTSTEQSERIGWSVKLWNRLNFVTATIPEAEHDPHIISSRWASFVHELRRLFPDLKVIRVLQMHPGGHGWHVHALFDRYIPSRYMLHYAALSGLGRLDFRMVSGSSREKVIAYIARYIARDSWKRPKSAKGIRLITAAGSLKADKPWWVRLADITIESSAKRLRASLIAVLATHGIKLPAWTPSVVLFGQAPPEALAEWRSLNAGWAY